MDGRPDARIRAATAHHVRHRIVDILVAWLWFLLQERGSCHELGALAITALHHVDAAPCGPERNGLGTFEPFYGGDLVAAQTGDNRLARHLGCAIHMHRAGSAHADPAAKFGPGHTQFAPQHPKQRRSRVRFHKYLSAVDVQR